MYPLTFTPNPPPSINPNPHSPVKVGHGIFSDVEGLDKIFKCAKHGIDLLAALVPSLPSCVPILGSVIKGCSEVMIPFQFFKVAKEWSEVKKKNWAGITSLVGLTALAAIGITKFLNKIEVIKLSGAVSRIGKIPVLGTIVQLPLGVLTAGIATFNIIDSSIKLSKEIKPLKKNRAKLHKWKMRNNSLTTPPTGQQPSNGDHNTFTQNITTLWKNTRLPGYDKVLTNTVADARIAEKAKFLCNAHGMVDLGIASAPSSPRSPIAASASAPSTAASTSAASASAPSASAASTSAASTAASASAPSTAASASAASPGSDTTARVLDAATSVNTANPQSPVGVPPDLVSRTPPETALQSSTPSSPGQAASRPTLEDVASAYARYKISYWQCKSDNSRTESKKAMFTIANELSKLAFIILGLVGTSLGIAALATSSIPMLVLGLVVASIAIGKKVYDIMHKDPYHIAQPINHGFDAGIVAQYRFMKNLKSMGTSA